MYVPTTSLRITRQLLGAIITRQTEGNVKL